MSAERHVRELIVQLPPQAPQARITAGLGSAGQKTWNLRRPVTLIGARRPAHIVLHDPAISNAHCVVVNTGTEILLKDLHTSGGTYLNGVATDLAVLKDGDLLRLGEVQIQVAISMPETRPDDSGCGLRYADPARFALPVHIRLDYTDMAWEIDQAVVLVGRHEGAAIRLDHNDLSARHAVLFRFQDSPALFDISDKTGLLVNEESCSLTPLSDGDRITLGPFTLLVGRKVAGDDTGRTAPVASTAQPAAAPSPAGKRNDDAGPHVVAAAGSPPIQGSIENLGSELQKSWQELNSMPESVSAPDPAAVDLAEALRVKEAELEARDAALRGKLHDITQYHELVLARERDLGALSARIQAEFDEAAVARKAHETMQQQIDQQLKELQRREQMLSQRWARMQATTCPHCGRSVTLGAVEDGKLD